MVYNPTEIICSYCKRHNSSDKLTKLATGLGIYFEGYTELDAMLEDIESIFRYRPHLHNSGCFLCYYSDIEDECIRCGYKPGQKTETYERYYNTAIAKACRALKVWAYAQKLKGWAALAALFALSLLVFWLEGTL